MHQYVVACIGSVRADELCEWNSDNDACQYTITLDEGAMRRLEAYAFERLQTWEQMQSQESGKNFQLQVHNSDPSFSSPFGVHVSA